MGVERFGQRPSSGPWAAWEDHDSLAEVEHLDIPAAFDTPPTSRASRQRELAPGGDSVPPGRLLYVGHGTSIRKDEGRRPRLCHKSIDYETAQRQHDPATNPSTGP